MNAKEFTEKYLQNCEYGSELSYEAEHDAKSSKIVIVFGASDDLCEFRGAVDDEVGCFDGGDVYINAEGRIANNDYEDMDDFVPEDNPGYHLIRIIWDDAEKNCAWSYKTDIPHEEFKMMEEGELYCIGIVFCLDDLRRDEEETAAVFTREQVRNIRCGRTGSVDHLNTFPDGYKGCPVYIIPHWEEFKAKVNGYMLALKAGEPQKMYYVQVGAFSVKEYAENFLKEVKEHYPKSFIKQFKGSAMYYVQVGAFTILGNAERYLKEIRNEYPDAFIKAM